MVLRSRICRRNQSPLSGQTLHNALQQQALSWFVNSLHALLPVVPWQGASAMETQRQSPLLQSVQMGHSQRVLEFLCLVQGARAS